MGEDFNKVVDSWRNGLSVTDDIQLYRRISATLALQFGFSAYSCHLNVSGAPPLIQPSVHLLIISLFTFPIILLCLFLSK